MSHRAKPPSLRLVLNPVREAPRLFRRALHDLAFAIDGTPERVPEPRYATTARTLMAHIRAETAGDPAELRQLERRFVRSLFASIARSETETPEWLDNFLHG